MSGPVSTTASVEVDGHSKQESWPQEQNDRRDPPGMVTTGEKETIPSKFPVYGEHDDYGMEYYCQPPLSAALAFALSWVWCLADLKVLKILIAMETHGPWLATNEKQSVLSTMFSQNQVLQSSQNAAFLNRKFVL